MIFTEKNNDRYASSRIQNLQIPVYDNLHPSPMHIFEYKNMLIHIHINTLKKLPSTSRAM